MCTTFASWCCCPTRHYTEVVLCQSSRFQVKAITVSKWCKQFCLLHSAAPPSPSGHQRCCCTNRRQLFCFPDWKLIILQKCCRVAAALPPTATGRRSWTLLELAELLKMRDDHTGKVEEDDDDDDVVGSLHGISGALLLKLPGYRTTLPQKHQQSAT